MIELQNHVDYIMDHFDFDKVEKVMKSLNWKWFGADTEDSIPDKPTLRKEARRLLKSAWEYGMRAKGDWIISTGGFTAQFHWEFGLNPTLQLAFTIEEVCS